MVCSFYARLFIARMYILLFFFGGNEDFRDIILICSMPCFYTILVWMNKRTVSRFKNGFRTVSLYKSQIDFATVNRHLNYMMLYSKFIFFVVKMYA